MANDKKKRAQPSNKRRKQKQQERTRKPGEVTERAGRPAEVGAPAAPDPDLPGGPDSPKPRKRPGEGLDKSDEGVIAGRRIASGNRFD